MHPEHSFYYYIKIIEKWKIKIVALVAIAFIASAVTGLMRPNLYEANLIFVIGKQDEPASGISGILFSISIRSKTSPYYLALGLLESRRMAEDIAKKFNFVERYKLKSIGDAVIKVNSQLSILSVKRSKALFCVKVITEDPKLSADMANFAVHNLDALNVEFALSAEKPFVKIIDPAVPLYNACSGNILRKIGTAVLFSFFLGVVFAILSEYFEKNLGKKNEKTKNSAGS